MTVSHKIPSSWCQLLHQMSKIKCEDRIKMVLCDLMCFYESFVILSSFRISNLQRELEKSRLKEADETRAMEDVVRMVEQNLEKTTVDFYLCCFYLYYLFVQFLIRTVQVLFFLFKTFCSNDLSFFCHCNSQVNSDIRSAFKVRHRSIKPATPVHNL